MPVPVLQTLVNQHAYDFSSIETVVNGVYIPSQFNEISYTHSLESSELRGSNPHVLGRTRGQYTAEGSISMYLEEWKLWRAALIATNPTKGFMEISFLLNISYLELPGAPTIDTLVGCRVTSLERSHSQGSDPLTVSASLNILRILEDGAVAALDNVPLP